MIKVNLSKLMGMQKMNIQDLHKKTGLNRNTISNLYHESVRRIDFETIDKLCVVLGCQPGDILEFIPDKE